VIRADVSYMLVVRWEEKGGCFFFIFVCGGVRGGGGAVICYDKSMVIEEI